MQKEAAKAAEASGTSTEAGKENKPAAEGSKTTKIEEKIKDLEIEAPLAGKVAEEQAPPPAAAP